MTLNVRLPARIADTLAAEAAQRDCRPDQLAIAIVACAMDAKLIDAILDDANPVDFVPAGVARLQVRVLRALASFKAPNGTSLASYNEIATYLGLPSRGCIHATIKALAGKGMVDIVDSGKAPKKGQAGSRGRYRLTEKADLLLKELGR